MPRLRRRIGTTRVPAVAAALLVAGLVVGLVATGCSVDTPRAAPPDAPLPPGLTAYVDQSRLQRQTRTLFVRLVNDADRRIVVTRAEISSPRYADVTWTGERSFENEADLEFELPPASCGTGSEARVRLTYRVDGAAARVSETTATDRYGAVGLFLDRDCAQQTLAEAATVELGTARVVGSGADSVFELPVSLVPTGARDDVSFLGFDGTVLFAQAPGSTSVADGAAYPLGPGDPPVETVLRLVPARCDPHALAEDKVGTLVGVHVRAPGLPATAAFYLPIGDERRALLRGSFFPAHCGLSR